MDHLIALYQECLDLKGSLFSRIDHDDAMVAVVYKIALRDGSEYILKICSRTYDYRREIYFLEHFAGKLPVPRIINIVPPASDLHGAIMMEYLPGILLNVAEITDRLAYEMGSLLAQIHCNRATGYGDLIQPEDLKADPHFHFTLKFQEGIEECRNHLPKALIEQCLQYYKANRNLLTSVDGPCMIHRDFRPGNMIVADGKIRGIIDWSSARASFAEDDFCSMEHGVWPCYPASKKAFLSGYASIRPVPDYKEIMAFLRLNRAIATIGFTVKRGVWDNRNACVYNFNRRFLEAFF